MYLRDCLADLSPYIIMNRLGLLLGLSVSSLCATPQPLSLSAEILCNLQLLMGFSVGLLAMCVYSNPQWGIEKSQYSKFEDEKKTEVGTDAPLKEVGQAREAVLANILLSDHTQEVSKVSGKTEVIMGLHSAIMEPQRGPEL